MGRLLGRVSWLRVVVVLSLVTVSLPSHSATASAMPTVEGIAGRLAKLIRLDDVQRPPVVKMHVAVISSGIDVTALPIEVRDTITGARSDAIGYGTYAASVLYQLAPQAQITSYNVYSGSNVVPGWLLGSLRAAAANAKSLDAVVLAFPPNQYLDPISASMAAGQWARLTSALGEAKLDGRRGQVFGLPMNGSLLWQATKNASASDRALLYNFRSSIQTWNAIHDALRATTEAGVGVVAPAGDIGPALQTVHGVASLPEVETAGGFTSTGPSALSASGPSIDGRVKPDVLAPTGIVGVLPQRSTVAQDIGRRHLLDSSLQPAWSFSPPPTTARSRLDTTLSSAVFVTASMAAMSADGLRDVAKQRAALAAASVPYTGVPAWRQGSGQLRFAPDAQFASSRPLVIGNGDLGAEPDTGTWSSTLRVVDGQATGASAKITDFAGVSVQHATVTRSAASSPPLSVSASKGGIVLDLPLGTSTYEGGLYCGYTAVSVPTTGDDADPRVHATGLPDGVQNVPTCFVKGSRLRAFGFYIHDLPAENLTFGLLPAMPPGSSLLDKPLMLLPVDPLATKLFFKVTGTDGNAYFSNIPPGYYTIRQWSDYGAPITQTVTDSRTNRPIRLDTDIGEEVSYQSFEALVLTPLCTDQVSNAAGEDLCTSSELEKRFGSQNVTFDPTTWTYLVTIAPGVQERIVFDRLKKTPGPAVSSRYIDLLSYKDFTFLASKLPAGLSADQLNALPVRPLLQTWGFLPGTSPESISATYNPPLGLTGVGGGQVGIASYPFNLTTPNYKAHMSLDFTYALRNAAIIVAVQMGDDVGSGVVMPVGEIKAPIDDRSLQGVTGIVGRQGRAHFDFHLLPKGAAHGKLWLLFVPPVNTVLASANVGDMSFELDTWTRDIWPPATFPGPAALIGTNPLKPGVVAGHSFVVDPNYSTAQMSHPACRWVDQGGRNSNVCEDWVVMVHSPGDDAATFDVTDARSGRTVKPELVAGHGGYFDPHRGVHDFTHVLAFDLPSVPALEASVSLTNAFRTNGRFWEQLSLPMRYLALDPGPIEFRIVDNIPGRGSLSLGVGHSDGSVPVAPYVPFVASSSLLGP